MRLATWLALWLVLPTGALVGARGEGVLACGPVEAASPEASYYEWVLCRSGDGTPILHFPPSTISSLTKPQFDAIRARAIAYQPPDHPIWFISVERGVLHEDWLHANVYFTPEISDTRFRVGQAVFTRLGDERDRGEPLIDPFTYIQVSDAGTTFDGPLQVPTPKLIPAELPVDVTPAEIVQVQDFVRSWLSENGYPEAAAEQPIAVGPDDLGLLRVLTGHHKGLVLRVVRGPSGFQVHGQVSFYFAP